MSNWYDEVLNEVKDDFSLIVNEIDDNILTLFKIFNGVGISKDTFHNVLVGSTAFNLVRGKIGLLGEIFGIKQRIFKILSEKINEGLDLPLNGLSIQDYIMEEFLDDSIETDLNEIEDKINEIENDIQIYCVTFVNDLKIEFNTRYKNIYNTTIPKYTTGLLKEFSNEILDSNFLKAFNILLEIFGGVDRLKDEFFEDILERGVISNPESILDFIIFSISSKKLLKIELRKFISKFEVEDLDYLKGQDFNKNFENFVNKNITYLFSFYTEPYNNPNSSKWFTNVDILNTNNEEIKERYSYVREYNITPFKEDLNYPYTKAVKFNSLESKTHISNSSLKTETKIDIKYISNEIKDGLSIADSRKLFRYALSSSMNIQSIFKKGLQTKLVKNIQLNMNNSVFITVKFKGKFKFPYSVYSTSLPFSTIFFTNPFDTIPLNIFKNINDVFNYLLLMNNGSCITPFIPNDHIYYQSTGYLTCFEKNLSVKYSEIIDFCEKLLLKGVDIIVYKSDEKIFLYSEYKRFLGSKIYLDFLLTVTKECNISKLNNLKLSDSKAYYENFLQNSVDYGFSNTINIYHISIWLFIHEEDLYIINNNFRFSEKLLLCDDDILFTQDDLNNYEDELDFEKKR